MGDCEADQDFKAISQSNHNNISTSLTKTGYADGISEGRDSVFQDCFDNGYADGLKTGLRIAAYKSFAQHLSTVQTQISPELQRELEKFEQTELHNPESQEHFQMRQNTASPMAEISHQQNKYVDNLNEKIKAEFPLMYSFINIK